MERQTILKEIASNPEHAVKTFNVITTQYERGTLIEWVATMPHVQDDGPEIFEWALVDGASPEEVKEMMESLKEHIDRAVYAPEILKMESPDDYETWADGTAPKPPWTIAEVCK